MEYRSEPGICRKQSHTRKNGRINKWINDEINDIRNQQDAAKFVLLILSKFLYMLKQYHFFVRKSFYEHLDIWNKVITIPTARVNIRKFYISARPVWLCILCGSENKQRLLPYTTLTFYNWEVVCLLRGTDWVFTFNSGYCYCLKLCTSALIRNQNSVDLVSSQDSTLYITINSWTFQAC